jgi:Tfp pilus assembly protein PilF
MTDRMEKIKELLCQMPGDNFLKHALALEYIKMGNDADARNLFEEILAQDIDYVGSYYHLAKLLEKNNETDLAISWYKKGMEAAKRAGNAHAYLELQTAYQELIF